MDEFEKKIESFLIQLNLAKEEIKIFLALVQKNPMTILQLSRQININRTRVYRLIENLKNLGLVEERIDENKKLFKTSNKDHLELLVRTQEEKAKSLRDIFPSISNFIVGRSPLTQPETKVLFYRGKEGVKQQIWNTLQAKKEAVGYSYRPLKELVGDFYYQWRDEWISRGLLFRDIFSQEYKLARNKDEIDSVSLPISNFVSRFISRKIFNINHQVDIYNNVVSYYNWHKGEVFGVEIYNEKVAAMQKQLFEIVWKLTKS